MREELEIVGNSNEDDHVIVKSDRIVSFATPNGSLTSAVYKCMNAVILALQNDVKQKFENFEDVDRAYGDSVVYELSLPFVKFVDYMGWKSNNRTGARKAIDLLANLKVEWDILESQDGKGNKVSGDRIGFRHYVMAAEIDDGSLKIQIAPEIRRELLNSYSSSFLNLNLRIANDIWSDKYTPRLYEHCLMFKRDGVKKFEWSVAKFKELMNVQYNIVDGKKEYAYPDFKELKRIVINKSINNINNTNFIDFTVTAQYVGKPVRNIMFFIQDKVPNFSASPRYIELKDKIVKELNELGFLQVAKDYFDKKHSTEDYFDKEISVKELHYLNYNLNLYTNQKRAVEKPLRYFQTILNKNTASFEDAWLKIKEDEKVLEKQEQQRKSIAQAKKNEAMQKIENDVIKEYRKELVDSYLSTLTTIEYNELEAKCKKHNPTLKNNPLIFKAMFHSYIVDHCLGDLFDQKELNKLIKKAQAEAELILDF
ncbi:replication initiation protein [Catenovulum maritimum]|uniref:Uncharacterized protein n=1 Tax=Catenovulum maritimum TaxID=1513271 RepID=A0A0J8JHC0_9ALTE|nr:replication initiation protein [Catenovulum maritimum]KMT63816.1 hypothetical protein XM47_17550 [Catenovulum maritimum]